LLNYIGIAILLVGVATGEFIYWRSLHGAGSTADQDALVLLADSKAYDYEMQVNVGTFGMLTDRWERTIERLGEPGPLAIVIGVTSMLVAGGCFFVASRMPRA
jgi:hypothetical protein